MWKGECSWVAQIVQQTYWYLMHPLCLLIWRSIHAFLTCSFSVASLLKQLKHANIVRLHDIIHTKDTLMFVFEFVVSPFKWDQALHSQFRSVTGPLCNHLSPLATQGDVTKLLVQHPGWSCFSHCASWTTFSSPALHTHDILVCS